MYLNDLKTAHMRVSWILIVFRSANQGPQNGGPYNRVRAELNGYASEHRTMLGAGVSLVWRGSCKGQRRERREGYAALSLRESETLIIYRPPCRLSNEQRLLITVHGIEFIHDAGETGGQEFCRVLAEAICFGRALERATRFKRRRFWT